MILNINQLVKSVNKGIIIGITGGSGSGKSQVSKLLEKAGAQVCDADRLAFQISQRPEVVDNLVAAFGFGILHSDGKLNRQAVADIAFSDIQKKIILEEIITTRVVEQVKFQVNAFRCSRDSGILILDCPLLFELNLDDLSDVNWCVVAPNDVRVKRLIERDGLSQRQAEERLSAQMSDDEKMTRADMIIFNGGTFAELEVSVREALMKVLGDMNVKL